MMHNLSKEHVARLSPAVKDFLGIDDRDKTAEIKALLEKLDREKPEWLRERYRQMDEALREKQARQRANEGWPLAAVAAGAIAAGGAGCSGNGNSSPNNNQAATQQDSTQTGSEETPSTRDPQEDKGSWVDNAIKNVRRGGRSSTMFDNNKWKNKRGK